MKTQEFQNKLNDIQEKIGKDSASLILDDIGILLTDNQAMNTLIENKNQELENLKNGKDKEIERLKRTNETLQNVNGNLLQQIGMGEDTTNTENEEEKKRSFDFRTVFDSKGNFKR